MSSASSSAFHPVSAADRARPPGHPASPCCCRPWPRCATAAARTQSQNNLKQIGLACHNYYDANNVFPPGCDANNFSAAAYLLPYIEQDNLYKHDRLQEADRRQGQRRRPARPSIKIFLNPMDPVMSVKHGLRADQLPVQRRLQARPRRTTTASSTRTPRSSFADITDGTSNTLMAGETLKGDGGIKADGRAAAARPAEEGRPEGDQGRRRRQGLQGRQEHRRRPLRQLDGRPIPPGHVHRHARPQRRAARRELRRRRRPVGAARPGRRASTSALPTAASASSANSR